MPGYIIIINYHPLTLPVIEQYNGVFYEFVQSTVKIHGCSLYRPDQ